jgi:anti-sigma regulatory factor (Ser/Thr protein kinase)
MALELRLPPIMSAPSKARHATSAWLADVGAAGGGALDAVLVVSELVANGVVHDGGDDIAVRAERTDGAVKIEVVTVPPPFGPPPVQAEGDERGRGMALVAAVCEHLQVDEDAVGRRRVSCTVKLAPAGGAHH